MQECPEADKQAAFPPLHDDPGPARIPRALGRFLPALAALYQALFEFFYLMKREQQSIANAQRPEPPALAPIPDD